MSRLAQFQRECPSCHADLSYWIDGKEYSRLVGFYSRERDRTVAWRCPDCGAQWERGSTAAAEASQ